MFNIWGFYYDLVIMAVVILNVTLKGLAHAKIIKNRWFYFGFLIWPYDVNMSID